MIREYVGYRRLLLLFAVLAGALGALFWWLGGAAPGDIIYFLLLGAAVLAVTAAVDFFAFARRLRQLRELKENIMVFEGAFPEGSNAVERAYAEIASGLLARLRQETDALERMHRQDIDYYTMWVHQIKTPLSALRLLVENGSGGPAGEAAQSRELFGIERYVDMALSYARAATIASDTVIEPVAVEDVVRGGLRKYAPLFIARGLSVKVEGQAVAYTDAKWLAFILEQLLSNAAKYTEQGGVTVRIGPRALTVEDTGVGIRAQDLPRVFERGYTGYNGRVDKRASGLGLSLARQVADALHLALRLESEAGRGTRATLSFPSQPPGIE